MPVTGQAQVATEDTLDTQAVEEKQYKKYGPLERSTNDLRGIRYMGTEIVEGSGEEVEDANEDEDEDELEEEANSEVKTTEKPNEAKTTDPEFPWEKGKIDEDAAEKLVRNLRSDSDRKSRSIGRLTAAKEDLADKLEEAEKKLKDYETAEETKRVEGEKTSKKETLTKTLTEAQVPAKIQAWIWKQPLEEWDAEVKDAIKDFGKTKVRGARPLTTGHNSGDLDMSPAAIRARRNNS